MKIAYFFIHYKVVSGKKLPLHELVLDATEGLDIHKS